MVGEHTTVVAAVGLLLITSGCMGVLSDGTSSFGADPVEPRNEDLRNAGYEQTSAQSTNESRTVRIGGQDRDVILTNVFRTYERTVDDGSVSEITLYATPVIELDGETVNPVDEWSDQRLADHVSQRYDDVQLGDIENRQNHRSLGENTELLRYSGAATLDGQRTPVTVHVTTLRDDGDVVVGVAVHPQSASDEPATVATILGGLFRP